ncbi:hypothetical protein EBB07_02600 [Paenibacillaceae bacterium]|nr:hypothetical protein EBB07_02600 [Paenibacillaceae bacterium]
MLGLALLPHFASAADNASFAMIISNDQSEIGQTVRVTVKGEHLDDVFGYEIRLAYDATKLRFKSSSALWEGFSVPAIVKDGEITFAHTKVGKKQGVSGSADLAVFSFESIAEGKAAFKLTQVKIVDSKIADATIKTSAEKSLEIVQGKRTIHFNDIANHWGKQAIERAAALGWVEGYPDGSFRPQGKVTRAEFTAMLSRAIALPSVGGMQTTFADWDQTPEWAKPFILEAAGAGVIKGYENNTFRYDQPIKRSEMTVMVMRALGNHEADNSAADTPKLTFADADHIPEWARASVAAAANAGLIKGRGNNRFVPHDNTTRAEAVTLILGLLDYKQADK